MTNVVEIKDADRQTFPFGRRIAVLGKGGKTTLAKALAERFKLRFVEIDALRHLSGWQERPSDEFARVTRETLDAATEGWVTDANARAVRNLIMERVETVLILALPWRVMLWRTFKRSLCRIFLRQRFYNGNRETFRMTFMSRDSVVYDLWRRREMFRNIEENSLDQIPQGVRTVVIRSTAQLDNFYREHGLKR